MIVFFIWIKYVLHRYNCRYLPITGFNTLRAYRKPNVSNVYQNQSHLLFHLERFYNKTITRIYYPQVNAWKQINYSCFANNWISILFGYYLKFVQWVQHTSHAISEICREMCNKWITVQHKLIKFKTLGQSDMYIYN